MQRRAPSSDGSFSPGVVKRWEGVAAVWGCAAVFSVWGLGDGWVGIVLNGLGGSVEKGL
jgi:hypothetical protein